MILHAESCFILAVYYPGDMLVNGIFFRHMTTEFPQVFLHKGVEP